MQVQLDPAETCTALAAALLLPLRGITVKERKSREPAPAWLVRDGIKWNNRDADGVAALHACAPQLAQVHQQLQVCDNFVSSDGGRSQLACGLTPQKP